MNECGWVGGWVVVVVVEYFQALATSREENVTFPSIARLASLFRHRSPNGNEKALCYHPLWATTIGERWLVQVGNRQSKHQKQHAGIVW